jgi:mannose-6-phosphate isomerase-like protein (cupin superfamily)
MHPPLSLPTTLSSITSPWSPVLIASLNSSTTELKLAKIKGSFAMHSHPNSDELFYVLSGSLVIELEGAELEKVELSKGDMFVVPAGVRHRPISEEGAEIMLVEGGGVVNTGDAEKGELTAEVRDVRG